MRPEEPQLKQWALTSCVGTMLVGTYSWLGATLLCSSRVYCKVHCSKLKLGIHSQIAPQGVRLTQKSQVTLLFKVEVS